MIQNYVTQKNDIRIILMNYNFNRKRNYKQKKVK